MCLNYAFLGGGDNKVSSFPRKATFFSQNKLIQTCLKKDPGIWKIEGGSRAGTWCAADPSQLAAAEHAIKIPRLLNCWKRSSKEEIDKIHAEQSADTDCQDMKFP